MQEKSEIKTLLEQRDEDAQVLLDLLQAVCFFTTGLVIYRLNFPSKTALGQACAVVYEVEPSRRTRQAFKSFSPIPEVFGAAERSLSRT